MMSGDAQGEPGRFGYVPSSDRFSRSSRSFHIAMEHLLACWQPSSAAGLVGRVSQPDSFIGRRWGRQVRHSSRQTSHATRTGSRVSISYAYQVHNYLVSYVLMIALKLY